MPTVKPNPDSRSALSLIMLRVALGQYGEVSSPDYCDVDEGPWDGSGLGEDCDGYTDL